MGEREGREGRREREVREKEGRKRRELDEWSVGLISNTKLLKFPGQ